MFNALQHAFLHQQTLPANVAIQITGANASRRDGETTLLPLRCDHFVFRGGRGRSGKAQWRQYHISR
jgi:hypothetical protein